MVRARRSSSCMASATRTSRGRRSSPSLARSRRVLVPDLCGHGLSSRPDVDYSLDFHARTIARWLEELRVPQVDVVGHSYGGGVAQWMLLYPWHRVRKVGLVSAGGLAARSRWRFASRRHVLGGASRPAFHGDGHVRGPADRHPRRVLDARAREALAAERPPRHRARVRPHRAGRHRSQASAAAFHQHAHEIRDPAHRPLLGRPDPIIPIEHGIEAERTIPGATLACFARCGHYPHRERPAPSSTRCRPSSTARDDPPS